MPLNINETIASMDLREDQEQSSSQDMGAATKSSQNSEERSQNGITVYVGDLPPSMDENRLLSLVSGISIPPVAIRICRDLNTGESYGYGYLKYTNLEDANNVINALNCTEIESYTIRLELFDKKQQKDMEANVYVSELTPNVTARILFEFLAPLAPIKSIKIPVVQQKNGKPLRLRYGFIQFETKEKAERAIKLLNTTSIKGQYLKASKFQPVRERRQNKGSSLDYVIKFIPADMPNDILLRELNLQLVSPEEDGNHGLVEELKDKNVGIITKFSRTKKKPHSSFVFAFVTFHDKEMAKNTEQKLQSLNSKFSMMVDIAGMESAHPKTVLSMEPVLTKAELINSKRERSLKKESKMRKKNVYIRGLPKSYSLEDFTKICETFGRIESIWLAEVEGGDSNTQNKGYGYCCYEDPSVAEQAIECLNGHFIENRSLYASMATTMRERAMQMAGGRPGYPQMMGYGGHPGYMGSPYGGEVLGYYGGRRMGDMGRGAFHSGARAMGYAHGYGQPRYPSKRREYLQKEQVERIEAAVMEIARLKPSVARMATQSLMKVYGEKELERAIKKEDEFKKMVQNVVENIDSENLGRKDGRN